jgi:hypothetical protein
VQTQASWRERNADYGIAWRLQKRCLDAPDRPRVPVPLHRVPWDLAKDEFGTQGTEILGCFGRLLVQHAKDEMRRQVAAISGETPPLPPPPPKNETGGMAA